MSQKGQALVSVVFLMLIALSAGIIISSRFFKSLHVFTKSDNSAKASYVSEALAERLLYKSEDTLTDYVNNNSCLQECYVQFEDGSEAYAEVKILGNSSDEYSFKVAKDTSTEINLEGYPTDSYMDICWNDRASVAGMYINKSSGEYQVDTYAYNAVSSEYDSDFEVASPAYEYANCFRLNTHDTPILMRLKAFYEDTYLNIIPNPSSVLPKQGFLIKSNGRFLDTYKSISVTKKHSISPDIFDYVLYQTSSETSLSK